MGMNKTINNSLECKTIIDVMKDQSPTIDGWICPECRHHQGDIGYEKNVFISAVMANMKGCAYFEKERRITP